MKKFKKHTLEEYLNILSDQKPVPGGGSAAALTAALGAALIMMVANYSKGKNASKLIENKIKTIIRNTQKIRLRLLELVDLDAEAYLKVVKAQKLSLRERKKFLKQAGEVPLEVSKLCYKVIQYTPFLVQNGNKHLMSDIEVAIELLYAAFKSALVTYRINQ